MSQHDGAQQRWSMENEIERCQHTGEHELQIHAPSIHGGALPARQGPCAVHFRVESGQTPVDSNTDAAMLAAETMACSKMTELVKEDAGESEREAPPVVGGCRVPGAAAPHLQGEEHMNG